MNEILDSDIDKKPEMPQHRKILMTNLGILAFYTIFCFVFNKSAGLVLDAFLIVGHVGICLLVGIIQSITVKKDNSSVKGWFLSALLVLLIGFGTCVSFGRLSGL
jgi:amino acid permease